MNCAGKRSREEAELWEDACLPDDLSAEASAQAEASEGLLYMGNLDAKRDWGHAQDYIEAMHLILQQPTTLSLRV